MKKIRVIITDDHTLVRETWKLILNCNPRIEVIADCGTGEEAMEKIKRLQPDIAMMDINLPDMNGMIVTKEVKKYSERTRVLGISQHTQPAFAQKMMAAGAFGYLTKNSHHEEMIHAISEIAEGRKYICTEIKNILSEQLLHGESQTLNSLSPKELEVIGYVKNGYSSKAIAEALNVSAKTVEVHRYHILKKLGLKNTVSLINFINSQPEFQIGFHGNVLQDKS